MLKETEAGVTKLFCHIFSLIVFRLGEGLRARGPPVATPTCVVYKFERMATVLQIRYNQHPASQTKFCLF